MYIQIIDSNLRVKSMKKRIFKNMSLLALITVILFVGIWAFMFVGRFETHMKNSLKTLRFTLIDSNGDVIFDNYKTDLENHGDRPEVKAALENNTAEIERYSGTMGAGTYYYAIKLYDNKVLRVAINIENINQWLLGFIPIILLCLLIALTVSFILSMRLTSNIIEPINNMDLENSDAGIYDELTPLTKKIAFQKNQIMEQLTVLENRTDTIKTIADNMKEGLIFIDEKGVILLSNRSITELFGTEETLGKNILHLCRNPELINRIKQCFEGESTEMLMEMRDKSYTVYINPVRHNDNINGAIILFLDTTEKTKAEKQRREFSANVSHELKTPLTTISALSEMISNGMVKPDDIKDFASKISLQSKRLLYLIDEIIKLSEFDEGRFDSEFETFDLSELCKGVTESLQHKAAEKNVTLELSGEPMQFTGNKIMMDELLYNLIENAIKYNKTGGNVKVNISGENRQTKITIADTGIGISSEHINRIFERFYRVDTSRSKRTGGTGLGLSIVKHIVDSHNGKIEIESQPEVGTTIVCIFGDTQ